VGEGSLFAEPVREELRKAEEPLRRLARISDATTSDIAEARETAAEVERAVAPVAGLFDRIVAARIGEAMLPDGFSSKDLFETDTDSAHEVARRMDALHFPVAFPEVFLRDRPGFDALVGNPPWEEATVEKLGFWALRFPGLRGLSQPRQRREVQRLEHERSDIAAEYESAVAAAEQLRRLLLAGPYPGMGTAVTRISTRRSLGVSGIWCGRKELLASFCRAAHSPRRVVDHGVKACSNTAHSKIRPSY